MKTRISRPNQTLNRKGRYSRRSEADVEVRSAAGTLSLESAYGSVKPLRQPEDFKCVTQAAKDAKAERTSISSNKGG